MTGFGKLSPRVGVAGISSPLEIGSDRSETVARAVTDVLSRAGCDARYLGVLDRPERAVEAGEALRSVRADAAVLAASSRFEDYLALDLLEEFACPLLFWPQPGMETGALCGTQQAGVCLKQLGHPFHSVFGPAEDETCRESALSYLTAAAVNNRVRRARVGIAGIRARGMTEAAADEIALKRSLGPRVVGLDMAALLRRAETAQESRKTEASNRARESAGRVQVPDSDGLAAAGMYVAIRDVAAEEGLSALAFGCYPDYMGRACLAASLLADEGFPVACEGDVNAAVGMLLLTLLTGRPTHNTDWLDPLPDGTVVLTHCGSGSHSLAEDRRQVSLCPVRLENRGVCSLFPARTGPVTLLNLTPEGRGGYRMALLEGEAIRTEMVFPGNPLCVRFRKPAGVVIERIFCEGIGHHWTAGYGLVSGCLRHLAGIRGNALTLFEP